MNPLIEEYLNEEHRNEIQREFKQIRLQKKAESSRLYPSNMFTNFMRAFGQWMILKGERLVNRYEMPAGKSQSSSRSYAQ